MSPYSLGVYPLVHCRPINSSNSKFDFTLYQAAFGREADLGGLNFYLSNQTTPEQLAKALLNAAEWSSVHGAAASAMGNDAFVNAQSMLMDKEFVQRNGNGGNGQLSDTAFVELLYRNSLTRDADAAGLKFWGDYLGTGHSRAEMVAQWIQAAEVVGVQYDAEGLWLV